MVTFYGDVSVMVISFLTPYLTETSISVRESRICPRAEGTRADVGVEVSYGGTIRKLTYHNLFIM